MSSKMDIVFIRAAMTQSGKDGKFVGWNDESILDSEIERIKNRVAQGIYPRVSRVYTSGLTRGRETASLIYPRIPALINRNLDSIDYGNLEGTIYGSMPFCGDINDDLEENSFFELPGGESIFRFWARIDMGFKELALDVATSNINRVGVITHESVISIMIKKRALPKSIRQKINIAYGGGIIFRYDNDTKTGVITKSF